MQSSSSTTASQNSNSPSNGQLLWKLCKELEKPSADLKQLHNFVNIAGANFKDSNGNSLFLTVGTHCNGPKFQEAIGFLLSKKADHNYSCEEKDAPHGGSGTLFHCLLANEMHQKVGVLLDEFAEKEVKFDYSKKDPEGKTVLLLAVKVMSPLIKEILCATYSQDREIVNAYDKEGKTPLHFACALGMLDIVKMLLNCHAKTTIQDKSGRTPLEYAQLDKEEVKDILESIEINPNRSRFAQRNSIIISPFIHPVVFVLPQEIISIFEIEENPDTAV